MIMGHCSCGAHTNECAPEKHRLKSKGIGIRMNMGKWDYSSLLLLTSGIIMNALELPFFREGSVAL